MPVPVVPSAGPRVSPILDIIDRMMAAPAEGAAPPETKRNPHTGAVAASPSSPAGGPVLGPKGIPVVMPGVVKDGLDEAAELFRAIFKGELVP